jgi:hypothetical protein
MISRCFFLQNNELAAMAVLQRSDPCRTNQHPGWQALLTADGTARANHCNHEVFLERQGEP